MKQLYKNTYKVLELINLIGFNSICENREIVDAIGQFAQLGWNDMTGEMKRKLAQREDVLEKERTSNVEMLKIAVPDPSVEILLCLSELYKLASKTALLDSKT